VISRTIPTERLEGDDALAAQQPLDAIGMADAFLEQRLALAGRPARILGLGAGRPDHPGLLDRHHPGRSAAAPLRGGLEPGEQGRPIACFQSMLGHLIATG
jgi:hypothetical protein